MSRLWGFVPLLRRADPGPRPDGDVDVTHHDGASHVPATSGMTLLPRPVASVVSFLTQSTSLSLRVGSFFGGVAIDGARVTTLTGLELSRAIIEGVLTRAGRDVAIRSSEHGKAEAESLLERSLAALHTTVTSASFFAAATFHMSSTTLSSATHMSQALLSSLDATLGSTESSRAIAAIITLIRREFHSPSIDAGTEKVGVGDLLVGTVGFAMLQRWGRQSTERHIHANGGDETIWDVVILDNGLRADVVGSHQLEPASHPRNDLGEEAKRSSFLSPGQDEDAFDAVQRPRSVADSTERPFLTLPPGDQSDVSDEDIRLYIMSQLPRGCRASIKTDLVTARTITVDVFDDDTAEIAPPPGTMMIEERFHDDHTLSTTSGRQQLPKHTVVFRTAFNKSQSADVSSLGGLGSELNASSSSTTPRAHGNTEPSIDAEPKIINDSHHNITSSQSPSGGTLSPTRKPKHPAHKRNSISSGPSSPTTSGDRTAKAAKLNSENGTYRISNNSETSPKNAFGKGSLSRFAQKVKPTSVEKNESARRPLSKSPAENPSVQAFSTGSSQQSKNPKVPIPERKSSARGSDSKFGSGGNPQNKLSAAKPTSIANRGLQRSPPSQSSGLGLSSSPTARRDNARGAKGGRNSGTEYYSVYEKNKESFVTQTDAYSLRSMGARSKSPATMRAHVRSSSSMSLTRSENEMTLSVNGDSRPGSSYRHERSNSYSPGLYSLATAGSETSLILAHRSRKSTYDDITTIQALNRDGMVPGIFPQKHFVQNIRRFCRFSSASYGSNALKVMGVPRAPNALPYQESHSQEHADFSDHTGLPASTILLSSFVDTAGGTNAAGETDSGYPLVHYLFLDHESKAVVLTLRGTWGFEDVLTDMTCDYDDLMWQGKSWSVHKGMHASAQRLLMGGGGKVMITIRAALEEFPEYGVVFCGHSLGGGVAALLATMISEPNNEEPGTSFMTASQHSSTKRLLLTENSEKTSHAAYYLPSGRPIHVYAYGPPATMSPFLRRATRGLITTVVNGQDVVPSLSLGILHDMHTVSVAFKDDTSGARSHVRGRFWDDIRQSILNKFYVNEPPMLLNAGDGLGEDVWAWRTLKMLREEMIAPKLMPPGEVFVVETMRVLQRNAFTSDMSQDGHPQLGRPATRVQLKFIRDVESFFGELRFGSGMFSDHNPARYEASLAALARGILDD
ncbi:putative lipase [Aspergillus steynii IBT 23096]|uniref:sn-1-specific diacylglycerol lipase n=1 Tax=Aspergillus steynii IBT 23096 TaxID=1392250 RepID=A0A2I2G8P3_9EURO|nr:putative lipase [Aspergillus steynii IBT 23096]PLB49251.1 putative lipase [Aspergillus steynii IBT 23096]